MSIIFLLLPGTLCKLPLQPAWQLKWIQGKYSLSLPDLAMQCKLLHLLYCSQLYILCLPKSPKHKLFTRFSHSEEPLSCVNVTLRYCFNHCITIFDSSKSSYRRPDNISLWTKDNNRLFTAALLCYATLRHATPHHATPRHATPHHTTPRHATPHYTTYFRNSWKLSGVMCPRVESQNRQLWLHILKDNPASTYGDSAIQIQFTLYFDSFQT